MLTGLESTNWSNDLFLTDSNGSPSLDGPAKKKYSCCRVVGTLVINVYFTQIYNNKHIFCGKKYLRPAPYIRKR